MPNGFTHEHNVDLLTLAYTSQNYPEFRQRSYYKALSLWHLLGYRGYVPELDWSLFKDISLSDAHDIEPLVEALRHYSQTFKEVVRTNPSGPPNVGTREVMMLILSMKRPMVASVGYHIYWRGADDAQWRYHLPERSPYYPELEPTFQALRETNPQQLEQLLYSLTSPRMIVHGCDGLERYGAIEEVARDCILDLSGAQAILCASEALHKTSRWEAIEAKTDPFDDETTGLLMGAMREAALERAHNVALVRWVPPEKGPHHR